MRTIIGMKGAGGYVDVSAYSISFKPNSIVLTHRENLNSYEKKIKDIAENGILFACDDGSEKVISRRGKTNKKFLEEVESYLESNFDMEYYGDPT